MAHRLLKLLNIRPQEWPRVSLLFAVAFVVSIVGLWGTTTAYAAFLK